MKKASKLRIELWYITVFTSKMEKKKLAKETKKVQPLRLGKKKKSKVSIGFIENQEKLSISRREWPAMFNTPGR